MPADREALISALWGRATGGEDVAADPGRRGVAEALLPIGPSAVGADEAAEWFVSRISESEVPLVLLLVGGPGSGKSALAARVVAELEPEYEPSELARRSYRYSNGVTRVLLINDATIESDDFEGDSLATEISECVHAGVHAIVNVNRGILVEEQAARQQDSAGSVILEWLGTPHMASERGDMVLQADQDETSLLDYAVVGTLHTADLPVAEIAVVYMDVCSLFEARPECALSSSGVVGKSYAVARFRTRRDLDVAYRDSAAGSLLAKLSDALPVPEDGAAKLLDPVAANLQSLRSRHLQRGLVATLRGAELVTGSRFTYRELWGAIGLVTLGHLPSHVNRAGLQARIEELQPREADPVDFFCSVMRLAEHRGWQALFCREDSVSLGRGEMVDQWNPVMRLTECVDPVLDSHGLWSKPLFDAFVDTGSHDSPLGSVLSGASEDCGLEEVITPFDWAVDEAFLGAVKNSAGNDRNRRRFTAWYGRYLMRLLGIAGATPAFESEIDAWTLAWEASPDLPDILSGRLQTLLLPSDNVVDERAQYLPVFASRTVPLTRAPDEPTLVRKVEQNWRLTSRRQADQLVVSLVSGDAPPVEFDLDFTMIREALACDASSKGVTEHAAAASPRLERFRSALLRTAPGGTRPIYYVRDRVGVHRVYVQDHDD